MSKNKKKYRHGIEVKPVNKTKIKKHDLLRRIEILEEKLKINVGVTSTVDCDS